MSVALNAIEGERGGGGGNDVSFSLSWVGQILWAGKAEKGEATKSPDRSIWAFIFSKAEQDTQGSVYTYHHF